MGGKNDPNYRLVIDPRVRAVRAMPNVSKQVKAIRERLGFSRPEWAPKMGVGDMRLRKIENGGHKPSLDMIAAIVALIGKPIFEVFEVSEEYRQKAEEDVARESTAPKARAKPQVTEAAAPAAALPAAAEGGPPPPPHAEAVYLPTDLQLNLLAPPVKRGAYVATAQAVGRKMFSATAPTAAGALASAIALAQADRGPTARLNA